MSVVQLPTEVEVSPEEQAIKEAMKKLTKLFTSLSHPVRLQIVMYLSDNGPKAPVDMAKPLGIALGVLAYHVRELDKMGMIELKQETRVRGAVKHTYKLTTKGRRTVKLMKEWALARAAVTN